MKLSNPGSIFYPVESYNNRQRTERRWEDDARKEGNPFGSIHGWDISLKNGKRLRRHWTRNQGLAFVRSKYGERAVYNSQYDTASRHGYEGEVFYNNF